MILTVVLCVTFHIHSRNTHVPRLGCGKGNLPATVLLPIELRLSDPSLVDAPTDEGAEIFVVGVAWTVVCVEEGLKLVTRSAMDVL